ncbi:MAG: alpha/beta fold hydrolase [Anaerolineaceae bacterium]
MKQPHGVLILHGFASSLDSVKDLKAPLERLHLPVRMPVLRGHGGKTPDDLRGVTWRDWVSDAETALRVLMADVDKVIIVGHGMGGMLALILAANCRDCVDSLVLAATSIDLPKPMLTRMRLQALSPIVQRTFPRWSLPPVYADDTQRKTDTNYRWAPMDSIRSFIELTEVTRGRLEEVRAPVMILQSRKDRTITDECPEIIRTGISTPEKLVRIKWFEQSEHELFRDCERQAVIEAVVDYVMERVG